MKAFGFFCCLRMPWLGWTAPACRPVTGSSVPHPLGLSCKPQRRAVPACSAQTWRACPRVCVAAVEWFTHLLLILVHAHKPANVVGNLVHRDVMSGQGPGLVASRATEEQHAEFIASRDAHFRPVGLEQGPDGALYLIDMQREVIEHPDYIPDQIMDRYQIRGGEDRGRIYRIHPTSRPKLATIHPGSSDLAGQVALLGHEHGWVRATAQRLIVEKAAPEAPELLTQALRAETALHRPTQCGRWKGWVDWNAAI